jgi:hypothetical protein
MSKLLRNSFPGLLLRWGARLRFPYLFLLTAAIFIADLAIPDVVPMADEILIGLITLGLANLKKKPAQLDEQAPEDEPH